MKQAAAVEFESPHPAAASPSVPCPRDGGHRGRASPRAEPGAVTNRRSHALTGRATHVQCREGQAIFPDHTGEARGDARSRLTALWGYSSFRRKHLTRRRSLMDLRVKAWHLPPRLITGAYFLNAGLSKRGADDATAGQLHGFAAGTIRSLASSMPNGSPACCPPRRSPSAPPWCCRWCRPGWPARG